MGTTALGCVTLALAQPWHMEMNSLSVFQIPTSSFPVCKVVQFKYDIASKLLAKS